MNRLLIFIMLRNPRFWVKLLYSDIWQFRKKIKQKRTFDKEMPLSYKWHGWRVVLYNAYWQTFGSFIGVDSVIEEKPIFPHGPLGVFISNSAHIGKKALFFSKLR